MRNSIVSHGNSVLTGNDKNGGICSFINYFSISLTQCPASTQVTVYPVNSTRYICLIILFNSKHRSDDFLETI